ncbi:MAG: carboxymuconolactone decarboxylase family protein [Akkermansia sp.]|nr:carboxymuconolactone decarboxylase family protein [Akkermansia sp.]
MKTYLSILSATLLAFSAAAEQPNATQQDKTMNNKITQTAGRDQLGDFAPDFAHFNDDVLFGENWNNSDIDLKTRSLVTVVALVSMGMTDSSLQYHLENARKHGVTKAEMAAVITHVAFYAGWPKAWAAFRLAKEVWKEAEAPQTALERHAQSMMFPLGQENTAYAKYFIGKSYLAPVSTEQVKMYNVTFEPRCRNNWHVHHAKSGGGQMLIGVAGHGWYQEWGKEPVEIKEGTVIHIPAGVKHWHGAAKDGYFSHLAVEIEGEETSNEWLEPVTDAEYDKLPQGNNAL